MSPINTDISNIIYQEMTIPDKNNINLYTHATDNLKNIFLEVEILIYTISNNLLRSNENS